MPQADDQIRQGPDGVWRHPSGRPCSYEFHQRAASSGGGLTASAHVAYLAATGGQWVSPAQLKAQVSADQRGDFKDIVRAVLLAGDARRAQRDLRVQVAQAQIAAADLAARKSIRATANWRKR